MSHSSSTLFFAATLRSRHPGQRDGDSHNCSWQNPRPSVPETRGPMCQAALEVSQAQICYHGQEGINMSSGLSSITQKLLDNPVPV